MARLVVPYLVVYAVLFSYLNRDIVFFQVLIVIICLFISFGFFFFF